MRNCEGRRRRLSLERENWAHDFAHHLAEQRLDEAVHAAVALAREEFEKQLLEALARKEADMSREIRRVVSALGYRRS